MADQVWGTGYGSKRHIIAEGTRKEESTKRYGRERYAQAACSSEIHLSFFSDTSDKEQVMAKSACPRCAKKAGMKPCEACHGAGVVEA